MQGDTPKLPTSRSGQFFAIGYHEHVPFHVCEIEFDELVDQAIAQIPEELFNHIDNCFLDVEDEPTPEEGPVFGYYHGVPLHERGASYSGGIPDRIVIFRKPIMSVCTSHEELVEQIRITVLHEIGHHFGMDDHRLHELGYA